MAKRNSKIHFGLAIPRAAREKLRKAGIFVRTSVTVEHQHLAHRYVVRGVESGGAVETFGHYLTFAAQDGSRLPCLCQVESLAVNGPHAVVVAPALVRAEVLRVGNTYELLITRHSPGAPVNGKKPTLESKLLFRGRHGHLAENGIGVPEFWSRSGEPLTVPERFVRLIASVVQGCRCRGCEHSHYLGAPEKVCTGANTNPGATGEMEVGHPDWAPLERILGPVCTQFMWMGHKGDVQFYKHIHTRRYLCLDSSGQCYREGPQGLEPAKLEAELKRLVE